GGRERLLQPPRAAAGRGAGDAGRGIAPGCVSVRAHGDRTGLKSVWKLSISIRTRRPASRIVSPKVFGGPFAHKLAALPKGNADAAPESPLRRFIQGCQRWQP